jgi:hypothetical protein
MFACGRDDAYAACEHFTLKRFQDVQPWDRRLLIETVENQNDDRALAGGPFQQVFKTIRPVRGITHPSELAQTLANEPLQGWSKKPSDV